MDVFIPGSAVSSVLIGSAARQKVSAVWVGWVRGSGGDADKWWTPWLDNKLFRHMVDKKKSDKDRRLFLCVCAVNLKLEKKMKQHTN